MSHLLPRFYAELQAVQDAEKIGRIIMETGPVEVVHTVSRATLPGDKRRLRGIPVAGGACGTSPGTDPLHAVLR